MMKMNANFQMENRSILLYAAIKNKAEANLSDIFKRQRMSLSVLLALSHLSEVVRGDFVTQSRYKQVPKKIQGCLYLKQSPELEGNNFK